MRRRGALANKKIDAEAKCPFYFSETGHGIRCEGICTPTMVSVFAAEKDKRRHEERFCVSMLGYPDCPVYRALALKYRNEA